MIALDTNVLVRFLVQDDLAQGQAATELISNLTEKDPGYICREVIVETIWVLERAYGMSRSQIVPAIEGLLSSRELVIEQSDRVGLALSRYATDKAGFSDQMIRLSAVEADCKTLVTFDRAMAREQDVRLLET